MELPQQALRAYEAALRHEPDHLESLVGLARTLRPQHPDRALDVLLAAFQQFPRLNNEAPLWKELADAHASLHQYEQAHQAALRGLSLQQNDPALLLVSAEALEHLNPGHAQHLYRTILAMVTQRRPNAEECDIARQCLLRLGLIESAEGNWKAAISELQAAVSFALQANSDAELLWCLLANAHERGGNIEGALAVCRDAIQVPGVHRRVSLMFGYLTLVPTKQHQGDPIAAISVLAPLAMTEHDDELDCLTWYLLGRAHSIAGNPRQAYDAFQCALRKGGSSSLPWLAVGSLYLKMGQLPDALAAYSQAARLLVDDGSVMSAMASASAWDGLACVYERCDDQAIDAADAYARAASCYRAAGELRAASQAEQRAHSLQASARGEAPVPALRMIPETPLSLLRDIVIGAIQDDVAAATATNDGVDNNQFHHLPLPRRSLAAGSNRSSTPTDKGTPVNWTRTVTTMGPVPLPTPVSTTTLVGAPPQQQQQQQRQQQQQQQQQQHVSPLQPHHSLNPPPISTHQTTVQMAPSSGPVPQLGGHPLLGQPMAYYPPGVVWR